MRSIARPISRAERKVLPVPAYPVSAARAPGDSPEDRGEQVERLLLAGGELQPWLAGDLWQNLAGAKPVSAVGRGSAQGRDALGIALCGSHWSALPRRGGGSHVDRARIAPCNGCRHFCLDLTGQARRKFNPAGVIR